MGLTNACWSSPFFLFSMRATSILFPNIQFSEVVLKLLTENFIEDFLRINFLLNMEFAGANDR